MSHRPHFVFPLPQEFLADIRARGKKQVYILKPDAGCQGKGIRLVQGGKEEVRAGGVGPHTGGEVMLAARELPHGFMNCGLVAKPWALGRGQDLLHVACDMLAC